MNTLIYSKLWHMIRLLFSFTAQEMGQLQQIAAAFSNNNAKLNRFSFEHLTLPISQDGLQLFDPHLRANALQWRWLHYLLYPSQPNPPTHMPSIPLLRFAFNHIILSDQHFPSYHWSLLFPSCRPIIPRIYGVIVNFLKATDSIDNDIRLGNRVTKSYLKID